MRLRLMRFLFASLMLLSLAVDIRPAAALDAQNVLDRARELEESGLVDDAVAYLRQALAEDSEAAGNARVMLELARLSDDVLESLDLTARVLETTRNDGLLARAHEMRADLLYASAQYAQAAEEYDAALRRSSADASLELRHAASLLASGDSAGAQEAYERVRERTDGEPRAWASLGLGLSLLESGQAQSAAGLLTASAEEIEGDDPQSGHLKAQLWAAAAVCFRAAGKTEDAARALSSVIESSPGSIEAVLAADRLRRLQEEPRASESKGGESAP